MSVILPYTDTRGAEAVELYGASGQAALEWQAALTYDIMAVNGDGLWVHQKFGYSVPRRNGKSEMALARCIWGLKNGERILYTAHRASTAHSIWERLSRLCAKTKVEIDSSFRAFGKEHLYGSNGGIIEFRTRTSTGGLGEGYDLLVVKALRPKVCVSNYHHANWRSGRKGPKQKAEAVGAKCYSNADDGQVFIDIAGKDVDVTTTRTNKHYHFTVLKSSAGGFRLVKSVRKGYIITPGRTCDARYDTKTRFCMVTSLVYGFESRRLHFCACLQVPDMMSCPAFFAPSAARRDGAARTTCA